VSEGEPNTASRLVRQPHSVIKVGVS
jgi:hypothetical protein